VRTLRTLTVWATLLFTLSANSQAPTGQIVVIKLDSGGVKEPISVPASPGLVQLAFHSAQPLPPLVFVRIFRGGKAYLIKHMPQFFKEGCVNYSSSLLTADRSGFMTFRGLDTDFLSANNAESFTLVFEAHDADVLGQSLLRLSNDPKSIQDYFDSGIEISLKPPLGFVHPATVVSLPKPPHAGGHAAPPVVLPPCHTVTPYQATVHETTLRKPNDPLLEVATLRLQEVPCKS